MLINIARIYYPVLTLGPGERLGIWTAGCKKKCKECISPNLQDPKSGRAMDISDINNILSSLPKKPQGFTISGGEPFLNPKGLNALLKTLRKISDDIIVFTGYTLNELLQMNNDDVNSAINECAVLIDGPYIANENNHIGLRGSKNQTIHVFRHNNKYKNAEQWPRELQNISYANNLLIVGMP